MGLTDRLKDAKTKFAGGEDEEVGDSGYDTIEDNLEKIKQEIGGPPKTGVDDLKPPEPTEVSQETPDKDASGKDEVSGETEAPKANPQPDSVVEQEGPGKDELMEEIAELESESGVDDEKLESLEKRIKQIEEEVLSSETEELSRIGDLEERIRELEVDEQKDSNEFDELENRLDQLRADLDSMETPQLLDDRLTELEDLTKNPQRRIDWLVENGLEERLNVDADTSEVEERMDQLGSRLEKLDNRLKEQKEVDRGEVGSLKQEVTELRQKIDSVEKEMESRMSELEESSGDVEELWEAMDEEVSMLERRIEDNRQQNEQLLDQMVELTELVKDGLR